MYTFFQRSSALLTCRSSSKMSGSPSKKSRPTQAQPNRIEEEEEEEEEEDEEEQDLTPKKHRMAEHVGQIRKQRVIHLFVLLERLHFIFCCIFSYFTVLPLLLYLRVKGDIDAPDGRAFAQRDANSMK